MSDVKSEKKESPATDGGQSPVLRGELSCGPSWLALKILSIVTGLIVVSVAIQIVVRHLFRLRRKATVTLASGTLKVSDEWTLFDKPIRQRETISPLGDLRAVRLENRQRYLHLLVGFGALVVGTGFGIHWLVDGLGAGYPYLALVGAGVVAAGVVVDVVLYLAVPAGAGSSRIILVLGPWQMRIRGVDRDAALGFVKAFSQQHAATSGR